MWLLLPAALVMIFASSTIVAVRLNVAVSKVLVGFALKFCSSLLIVCTPAKIASRCCWAVCLLDRENVGGALCKNRFCECCNCKITLVGNQQCGS